MYLHSYKIKNYRRLKDVRIELAADISIFVGSNNSGKTSATQALFAFATGSKDRFSLYDFSAACWDQIDIAGEIPAVGVDQAGLPSISLDLWFEVTSSNLYLAMPLLPSTSWAGTQVGMRIEFSPRNTMELLEVFRSTRAESRRLAAALTKREDEKYLPWPKTLTDYLKTELLNQYELKYYQLDRAQFDDNHNPIVGYEPQLLGKDPGGGVILKSLIKIDTVDAQRHLADPGAGPGRSEDLSKRLSRFYKRNLDQRQEDHDALRALFDAEVGLNSHLADVFKDTLLRISTLGYPGKHNPRLEIKSALNPVTIMSSQDARVHYVLGDADDALRLPDTYNGLGIKNLIYMVVEVLDRHNRWVADKEQRALLHLVIIEEPEAHLHAQLQQVFIRNVLELMNTGDDESGIFRCQTVVTTHSPHILYERGFQPIRYFRRQSDANEQTTDVLNLSTFYSQTPTDRDFLQRYLKLTHCDLFFCDAVILVEGNVERLLLPAMLEQLAIDAPTLRSACLAILEVGGAFGHRFKLLIEFLGISALVITDLDSVRAESVPGMNDDDIEFDIPATDVAQLPTKRSGKACLPSEPGALTSNQTLIQWLPRKQTVAELNGASADEKVDSPSDCQNWKVRVAYQVPTDVEWRGTTTTLCGRTLEESFGLENAEWCQAQEQHDLGLRFRNIPATPIELAENLHKRVSGSSFDKTKFALGVLSASPEEWLMPLYIKEGLLWLNGVLSTALYAPLPAVPTASTTEALETVVLDKGAAK